MRLKELYIVIILSVACQYGLAQKFIPFPENFQSSGLEITIDGDVLIGGNYSLNGRNYFAGLEYRTFITTNWDSTNLMAITSSDWPMEMRIFEEPSSRSEIGQIYFFTKYLNQYAYLSFSGYSGDILTDSISQGSQIRNLLPVKDSGIYCLISNNGKYHIVRKKQSSPSWQLLPIITAPKPSPDKLGDIFIYTILSLLLAAALLFAWFRKLESRIRKLIGIDVDENALRLQADRPLTLEELVNLKNSGPADAVYAITDVISNRNTPLPITIAINGAWGSGKSSIMNCIRELLEKDKSKRFITTWFNAWHQQSESNLLNAFLLKVINRYEKPFFRSNHIGSMLASFRFRTNLAVTRFIKLPVYRQLLVGFTIAFICFTVWDWAQYLHTITHGMPAEMKPPYKINWDKIFSENLIKGLATVIIPVISFFFLHSEKNPTVGAFVNLIYKKHFLLEAERNTPDLREKFRSQYWEIMEAMEDKTLVVFIDDLDRVNGSNIFEMLEALNFISDITSHPDDVNKKSLKVVFVLAMYIDQVAKNLGSYLQKKDDFADTELKDAEMHGKKYLEKMIQLNIPVPIIAS